MGIKGIYRELGPGKRVSLAKLATEHLESTGRPLRLAVDIAIWQFQTQAAKGGSNPAIRTLFYRFVRLLSHAIQPIFVFDGPDKPLFKRNKRAGRGDTVANATAKRLIRLFGLPSHQAPGEAEAECALLQQRGIVDAVLSEDVDTLMFGCTRTLRNWTSEGTRDSKTPTHVTVYDGHGVTGPTPVGLDRESMVLVAMMSGGDYLPEGVPGCGLKLACEIARAGFGASLCRLHSSDQTELVRWRNTLRHELATNESGFFRTRHKALVIPDSFPNMRVLRHYTHPVVSTPEATESLRVAIDMGGALDVPGIRAFVHDNFDWTYRTGAIKLIRVLSPSLLAQKLLLRSARSHETSDSNIAELEESSLVQAITGRRNHFSVDGMPELKVSHIPSAIVSLDMSGEEEEAVEHCRRGLALNDDEDFNDAAAQTPNDDARPRKVYDPTAEQSLWLPEVLVQLGAPLAVQDWEETLRAKTTACNSKKLNSREHSSASIVHGAVSMDRWLRTTKAPSRPVAEKAGPRKGPVLYVPEPILPPLPVEGTSTTRTPQPPSSTSSHYQRRPICSQPVSSRSKPSKPAGKDVATATAKEVASSWTTNGSQNLSRADKPKRPPETIISSSHSDSRWPSSTRSTMRDVRGSAYNYGTRDTGHIHAEASIPNPPKSHRQGTLHEALHFPAASPRSNTQKLTPSLKQTSITSFCTPSASAPYRTAKERRALENVSGAAVSKENTASAPCISSTDKPDEAYSRVTKVFVPRLSAVGYIKEVELSPELAETLLGADDVQLHGKSRKAWRQSRVSLIDLTDDTVAC